MLGVVIAVLSSIFIVELAPARLRRVVIPVIRLLASVPSVVYGLIGILVLVPFVGNHLITASEKASVQNVVELTGAGLLVTVVILTVMITPIMIALICEALARCAELLARGRDRARPEPAAGGARRDAARDPPGDRRRGRACDRARARRGDHDLDGLRRQLLYAEPVDGADLPVRAAAHAGLGDHRLPRSLGAPALGSTLYAFALLLLFSAFVLSVAGYLIKLPAAQVPGARMSVFTRDLAPRPTASRLQARPALLAADVALGRPAGARRRVDRRASGCA